MTDADDAVWIAAGGTRVEGSLATAARYETPVLPGTEHVAPVVHAVPDAPAAERPLATDPATGGYGGADGALAPPVVEPAAPAAAPAPGDPGPADPAPTRRPVDNSVAGSLSPSLRAMRGRDPEPAPLASHGPATVLAMCNQKGGVGKTTSTINLGAALAGYGRRVLLVDLDPQGALSAGLGIASHELDHTVYNLMLEPSTRLTDVLVPTGIEGVDLIPANIDLSAGEVQLINEVGREHTLTRALRPVLHAYDYILIDCQPSLGLLTINALTCAQGVIIPLAAEWFSLRGVHLLVDTIEKVQARINPDLSVAGVLVTMYDGRTVHSREVVGMLDQRFGDTVYDTIISRTVKFPETTVAGEPITSYAPTHPAAQAYRALAREVIAR